MDENPYKSPESVIMKVVRLPKVARFLVLMRESRVNMWWVLWTKRKHLVFPGILGACAVGFWVGGLYYGAMAVTGLVFGMVSTEVKWCGATCAVWPAERELFDWKKIEAVALESDGHG